MCRITIGVFIIIVMGGDVLFQLSMYCSSVATWDCFLLVSVGSMARGDNGKQWETHLLVGFVPKYESDYPKITLTLKQNYIPWSIYLDHGWSFEPLQCGMYANTVFGHDFWVKQPVRYAGGYYGSVEI